MARNQPEPTLIVRRNCLTRQDIQCMSNVPWTVDTHGVIREVDPSPSNRSFARTAHVGSPIGRLSPEEDLLLTLAIKKRIREANKFLVEREPVWWALWIITDSAPITRRLDQLPPPVTPHYKRRDQRRFVRTDPEASWKPWPPEFLALLRETELAIRRCRDTMSWEPKPPPPPPLEDTLLGNPDLLLRVASLVHSAGGRLPHRLAQRVAELREARRLARRRAPRTRTPHQERIACPSNPRK